MAKTEMAKSEMDYKVEDGARTLIRAEEIKRDKKLYAQCLKYLKKQRDDMDMVMKGKGNQGDMSED